MNNLSELVQMYDALLSGIVHIDTNLINKRAVEILNSSNPTGDEMAEMNYIIKISNILYNNTPAEMLPLEDGIYDLCMVWAVKHIPNYQVGAKPVKIDFKSQEVKQEQRSQGFIILDSYDKEPMFINEIRDQFDDIILSDFRSLKRQGGFIVAEESTKSYRDTAHVYPELVGTLDKCKFVLNKEAIDRGVFNDANVAILEREFFQQHINAGILDPNRVFSMSLELKMDGASIEAEICGDEILSARTRGDTNNNEATDLTHVFKGWKFPKASTISKKNIFGMKFEAMISNMDLQLLGEARERNYKNPRNTISGLLGANDARFWVSHMTLIPLETSLGVDRESELIFMDTYYSTEPLRYVIITGNYMSILYQISRFCQEAEYLRPIMPFGYDGIVVRYLDQDIIDVLGRENFVNKWCMAVKFNAQKKMTVFTGYEYSIGQNGIITPIAHYHPVELFGCIHQKTTVHSYKRFKELSLRVGDIVSIELINDVIPYISKAEVSDTDNNMNPLIEFPKECPECHSKILISESGSSALCPNTQCPGRNLSRMTNMLSKLGFMDFSEMTLRLLGPELNSLSTLLSLKEEDVSDKLGPVETMNFMWEIESLKTKEISDARIIGALGFTNIAQTRWEAILTEVTIDEIMNLGDDILFHKLISVNGIGKSMAATIILERHVDPFKKDLDYISKMPNVMWSYGKQKPSLGVQIRFSGIRDQNIINELSSLGYDINNKGVSKKTDILIIPQAGYTSSKTSAISDNCIIMTIDEFKFKFMSHVRNGELPVKPFNW